MRQSNGLCRFLVTYNDTSYIKVVVQIRDQGMHYCSWNNSLVYLCFLLVAHKVRWNRHLTFYYYRLVWMIHWRKRSFLILNLLVIMVSNCVVIILHLLSRNSSWLWLSGNLNCTLPFNSWSGSALLLYMMLSVGEWLQCCRGSFKTFKPCFSLVLLSCSFLYCDCLCF